MSSNYAGISIFYLLFWSCYSTFTTGGNKKQRKLYSYCLLRHSRQQAVSLNEKFNNARAALDSLEGTEMTDAQQQQVYQQAQSQLKRKRYVSQPGFNTYASKPT